MSHRAGCLLLLAVLLAGPGPLRAADAPTGNHIVLRSGKMLLGRVVGSERAGGTILLRVETDFGEFLVPRREVEERVVTRKPVGDKVFHIEQIRAIGWKGTVERKRAGGERWRPIGEVDRYRTEKRNVQNSVLEPGDRVRTGPDGSIDLMPHKDIWIRIAPNSEVEFPAVPEDTTVKLARGKTIQRVTGKPRGQLYRIRTKSTMVDHEFVLGGSDSFFSLETGTTDRLVVKEGAARLNGKIVVRAGEARVPGEPETPAGGKELADLPPRAPRFPLDDLVYVPPGTYTVGGDSFAYNARGERTTLTPYGCESFQILLDGFLIDRREVSADEFHDFATARPDLLPYGNDASAPAVGRERWPVIHVSWDAAQAFAHWCGKELPNEAQWEVTAHGGTERRHPWGDEFREEHVALGRGRWGEVWMPQERFEPVDARTPDVSPFGARSMVSGAAEWCLDRWTESPFHAHMKRPPDCSGRAVRGTLGHMRLRWCMAEEARGKPLPGFRCVVAVK